MKNKMHILGIINTLTSLDITYAIYGAGKFTKSLLMLVSDYKLRLPEGIIDDFCLVNEVAGIRVWKPADFDIAGVNEIILGTDFFQDDMTDSIISHWGKQCSIIDLFEQESNCRKLVQQECSRLEDRLTTVLSQLVEAYCSPPEARQSYHDHTKDPVVYEPVFRQIGHDLRSAGVSVHEIAIDIYEFESWLDEFSELKNFYEKMGNAYIEKCLEHFLSFKLLNISKDDILIDIAACDSPLHSACLNKGYDAYSLDLAYENGIHGRKIGADASSTGLPDDFASVLTMHCAYECFAGDADVGFLKEASRILDDNGRFIITPLYLDESYFICTSPYCDQRQNDLDAGALKIWREDQWKVPFDRHYSVEAFIQRNLSQMPKDMSADIYMIANIPELNRHYSGQTIYCYFCFVCTKMSAAPYRTNKNPRN
ncbi:hypothetical protein BVX99_02070 [bacterium F16]|nr:hypothetical protein BVX99_02070 [bacterium F16]